MDKLDNPNPKDCVIKAYGSKNLIANLIVNNAYKDVWNKKYSNVFFHYEDTEENKKILERACKYIDITGKFPCVHIKDKPARVSEKYARKRLTDFTKEISKHANKMLVEKVDKSMEERIKKNIKYGFIIRYPMYKTETIQLIKTEDSNLYKSNLYIKKINKIDKSKILDDEAIYKFINIDFLGEINNLYKNDIHTDEVNRGLLTDMENVNLDNLSKNKFIANKIAEMMEGRYNFLRERYDKDIDKNEGFKTKLENYKKESDERDNGNSIANITKNEIDR